MIAQEAQAETDRKGQSRKGYRCLRARIGIGNHQKAETERQREGSKAAIQATNKRRDRALLLQRLLLWFPLRNTCGFHYGIPLVSTTEYLWFHKGNSCGPLANICVEADGLWPRPVEIGDEQISSALGFSQEALFAGAPGRNS